MAIQLVMLICLLLLSSLILFRFKYKTKTPNLPPGPWKLLLIGNLHNLLGGVPHRVLHQLSQKYGPLMHLRLGEVPVVVVTSPDAAEQIMKTHDRNFASRYSILVAEITSYDYTNIGFSPYGDYWRLLRKICATELLNLKRVQSFRSLREEVFIDLARWIGSTVEGSAFNLTEKLFSSTYAVITRAALGKVTKERERLLPIVKEILDYAGGLDVTDMYPSIKLFQRISGARGKLMILQGEADKIVEGIINDHKVAKNTDHDEQEDFVDVLLKYQDDGLEVSLTNNNIKSVILEILTAGSETSATTMDWAMAEMLKNPDIMSIAQQEVRKVFDSNGCVDESCIHELQYLKAVVKETLRMHPPVSILLPRKSSETCEIYGYQIPGNTKIMVNAWAINRDSNYWKDADCFQPERFLDTQVDFRGNHFEFIPFGAGRRMCPGISFALATIEFPLAILLYYFDWRLPAGANRQDLDKEKAFGVTAARIKDLCLVPVIKRTLPLPMNK